MGFERPTLPDLVDRIQQDFVSRLELSGAVLRRSVVRVLSRVVAGAAHMLHGHLEHLSKQLFPDTAESANLRRWGSLWGVEPLAATFAAGVVSLTGTDGWVAPAGTKLLRSDGVEYSTAADATIAGGTATAQVTAALAGAAGNCDPGTELSFESPVAGIDSSAIAADGLEGGADEEGDDSLRARILERLRTPPQGGALTDYSEWAKEVQGVTRVWVTPNGLGVGSVLVRFMRDGDPDPIPDGAAVATLQAYLDERRPVTAAVTVVAPVAFPIDITLSVNPGTVAIRTAVEAELADLLEREAEPGVTLPLSKIRTAIGIVDGLDDYVLTSPAADVVPAAGQIPTLGVITWV